MEKLLVFTPVEQMLGGITFILFVIQLLYWLISYARPLREVRKQQPAVSSSMPPVSIIVYAKNESENLSVNLPSLLTQEYPEYEVIVVNDGSTDESDDVLKRFEQDYGHLYHTYIPEGAKYLSRKKLALTVGIKAANYDILLFTEANCRPLSKRWIASMVCKYTEQTDIVLGFCAYAGQKSGFMHRFIAYDNLIAGLQMLSMALIHRAFTGNGRNLSYRKSLFFRHGGFSKTLSLHAGDDDLYINEYANRHNTAVSYFADGITEMMPVEYFRVWKEMKVSRAATQAHYKGGRLTFYRMEEFVFSLFFITVLTAIVVGLSGNWLLTIYAALLYLLRFVAKAVVLQKSARIMRQSFSVAGMILFECWRPVFNQYIRIYRMFRGKNDYTFHLR